MGGKIRAIGRMILLVITMAIYLSVILIRELILGKNVHFAFTWRRKWINLGIRILGIQIEVDGPIPLSPSFLISNHRSMIDPMIILKYVHALPVGKAEIARYPLIGKAADTTGIIFLKREDRQSRANVRKIMSDKVKAGFHVLLFPEGTTSAGEKTNPFKKGSFEVATKEDLPITPIAIEYKLIDNKWKEEDSLITHFMKSFRHKKIEVKLYLGDTQRSDNSWTLLRSSQSWINEKLALSKTTWM